MQGETKISGVNQPPMNINDYHGYIGEEQPNMSLLESISNEFCNHLDSQCASIDRIQYKLHLIADRRNIPNTKADDREKKDKGDMIIQLRGHVGRLITNNSLLERIEKHLSEII